MPIKSKIMLSIACIEALFLCLLIAMMLGELRRTNNDALIKHATTTSSLFAATAKAAVLTYDLASLEAFVGEVVNNSDILYGRVLGLDGHVLAQSSKPEYVEQAFRADYRVEFVSDGVFDTFAEISERGKVYGRVEIGLDTQDLTSVIAGVQKRSIIIAIISVMLVALFFWQVGSYLTRQLYLLNSAAKSISEGDMNINLPTKGKGEITNLAIAFNLMAFSLKDASLHRDQFEAGLNELNRTLEARVTQRTEQIYTKNLELEKANKNIKSAQATLLQSEKMASLGVLAAGVAHEINNPIGYVKSNLNSLKSYVDSYRSIIDEYTILSTLSDADAKRAQLRKIDLLCQQYDLAFITEDVDSLLQESMEGMIRVADIVKNLKEFSHSETMHNYIMCNLNDCIKSALNMACHEIKYHCEVQTDFADLPLTYCCSGQLSQVILNLIINAGHAIEGQGIIGIRSSFDGKMLKVSVSDTGKGIPAADFSKLFDPFFTSKPVGEGTGLGLSIAYGIVKEHGGDIVVESEVGKGSCFCLTLPLVTTPGNE